MSDGQIHEVIVIGGGPAGYTAALIGFPAVDTPLTIFDTAVARVEEIGLGILSASLIHSLVLPNSLASSVLGLLFCRPPGGAKPSRTSAASWSALTP